MPGWQPGCSPSNLSCFLRCPLFCRRVLSMNPFSSQKRLLFHKLTLLCLFSAFGRTSIRSSLVTFLTTSAITQISSGFCCVKMCICSNGSLFTAILRTLLQNFSGSKVTQYFLLLYKFFSSIFLLKTSWASQRDWVLISLSIDFSPNFRKNSWKH